MVIFKYIFDENNTSFLGLNDLISKAIQTLNEAIHAQRSNPS